MVNRKELDMLNEILLRMSYDVNKTLSENKSLLSEQPLPLDYYYYDANGNLKTLPNLATNYPSGSTPAKKAYPSITNGSQYPKQRISALSGFGGQPKPKPISTDNSIQNRFNDQMIAQRDNTYVAPRIGSGAPTKPQVSPPDWKSKMNDYGYTTPQDATYVSPEYLGIQNPEMIKMAEKWEEQKRNSKPISPRSEVIMYDPNKGSRPNPEWLYNGKRYTRKSDAFAQYENDLKEWNKKYADGFEGWVARNGDAVHSVLGYTALGLALISMGAVTVLSGGAALPLVGLSLEGAAGAASLLLTAADAGLYAYEGDTRMAAFVAILGLFDVAQIMKAAKGLNVLEPEIKAIREKSIRNADELASGGKKLEDVYTQREIQIIKSLDAQILSSEAKLVSKEALRAAGKEFGELMIKGPKYFAASLLKLKTYGLLGGLVLMIDGIQMSYNTIYNYLSSEDEKVVSLTLALLKYAFTKQETQAQIQKNNQVIEEKMTQLDDSTAAELLSSSSGFDTKVTVKEGSLSYDNFYKVVQSYYVPQLTEKENKLLSGTLSIYNGTNKPVPFKTKEEGDKFREWFNTEFPTLATLIKLDKTGSFNNQFIRKAYNTPVGDKVVGDVYQEEMSITSMEPENDSTPTDNME